MNRGIIDTWPAATFFGSGPEHDSVLVRITVGTYGKDCCFLTLITVARPGRQEQGTLTG